APPPGPRRGEGRTARPSPAARPPGRTGAVAGRPGGVFPRRATAERRRPPRGRGRPGQDAPGARLSIGSSAPRGPGPGREGPAGAGRAGRPPLHRKQRPAVAGPRAGGEAGVGGDRRQVGEAPADELSGRPRRCPAPASVPGTADGTAPPAAGAPRPAAPAPPPPCSGPGPGSPCSGAAPPLPLLAGGDDALLGGAAPGGLDHLQAVHHLVRLDRERLALADRVAEDR